MRTILFVAALLLLTGCATQEPRPQMDCTDLANEIKRIEIQAQIRTGSEMIVDQDGRRWQLLKRLASMQGCDD